MIDHPDSQATFDSLGDVDAPLDSAVLARLIEEVRSTHLEVTRAYNRTYNRHNR